MKAMLGLALALTLSGCWFTDMHDGAVLLSATQAPEPGMVSDAGRVVAACPSLLEHSAQIMIYPAESGAASLAADREVGTSSVTRFHVEVTEAYPGNQYARGEHCYFDVGSGEQQAVVLVSKTACVKLCDASAEGDYQAIKVR